MCKENQEEFSRIYGRFTRRTSLQRRAAGSAVRTVVTQQKANCRAE